MQKFVSAWQMKADSGSVSDSDSDAAWASTPRSSASSSMVAAFTLDTEFRKVRNPRKMWRPRQP